MKKKKIVDQEKEKMLLELLKYHLKNFIMEAKEKLKFHVQEIV